MYASETLDYPLSEMKMLNSTKRQCYVEFTRWSKCYLHTMFNHAEQWVFKAINCRYPEC